MKKLTLVSICGRPVFIWIRPDAKGRIILSEDSLRRIWRIGRGEGIWF